MRKYQTNSNQRTFYQVTGQFSNVKVMQGKARFRHSQSGEDDDTTINAQWDSGIDPRTEKDASGKTGKIQTAYSL